MPIPIQVFLKPALERYFPYHRIKGNYTNEEYQLYSRRSSKINAIFWIAAFLFIVALIYPLDQVLFYINTLVSQSLKGDGNLYISEENASVSAMIFSLGFGFPGMSILMLRVIYGRQYLHVLDFMSTNDKIDILKLGKWMAKWMAVIAVLFFAYGCWSCVLVKKDSLYIKTFYKAPETIYYKDVAQMIDYQSPPRGGTLSDTAWSHNYYLQLKNDKKIKVPGENNYEEYIKDITKHITTPVLRITLNSGQVVE